MDDSKSATGLNADSKDTDLARQSGEEPLSGQQGRGTVDEPFDAGNAEGELAFTFRLRLPFAVWCVRWIMLIENYVVSTGSEGAPAKEGMTGVLGDAKKKAEELVGTKS